MGILELLLEVGGSIAMGSLFGWGLSKLIRGYVPDDKILVFSLGIISADHWIDSNAGSGHHSLCHGNGLFYG
jgi:hypothetical protein